MERSKLDLLEEGFECVSAFEISGEICVYVSKRDGSVVYDSEEYSGEPCPVENIEENDDYLPLPDKYDLDLGQHLVFEFVEREAPDAFHEVKRMFRKKGAYSRYKSWLSRQNLLEKWYAFELETKRTALLKWCQENGIPIAS